MYKYTFSPHKTYVVSHGTHTENVRSKTGRIATLRYSEGIVGKKCGVYGPIPIGNHSNANGNVTDTKRTRDKIK